jgi:hypothetical protein
MAQFVNVSRTVLLGTAWTGTAPGVGVATPSGTITTASDITSFIKGGGDPGWSANMVDVTNMGSLGYSVVIPGITTGDELVFDANSDWAASQLGAIVRTTLGGIARPGSSPIYADIKPTSASRSATNPSFVAACYISKWKPYGGGVGERAAASLTLTITGTFTDLTS